MKTKFGFIQGRVTKTPSKKILQYFPKDSWREEFSIASNLGFNFIEYIGERKKNIDNPIWSKSGLKEINYLNKLNKLKSHTFCDDYFINNDLLLYPRIENYFKNLSRNLFSIGIKIYVLALFEKSEIKKSNLKKYIPKLSKISKIFKKKKIKLALETNLNSTNLENIFKKSKTKNMYLVYDTGNRMKNNKLQHQEIIQLKNMIIHVHLKDKNLSGENVVFGSGNVDFKSIFKALKIIKYKGKFTFETNRGVDPLKTMINNKKLVLNLLNK